MNNIADALSNAACHTKPIIVFKVTAEGAVTFRKAAVSRFEKNWALWSVKKISMGEEEEVAGAAGFVSVEEAAEACAKWLSANGYSQLTPTAHARHEQAMLKAFAADLADTSAHCGSLFAEKRTANGHRILVKFSAYAYTCQPPFGEESYCWVVSYWPKGTPIATGKPSASRMEAAEECVAWLAKHGYTRLFI